VRLAVDLDEVVLDWEGAFERFMRDGHRRVRLPEPDAAPGELWNLADRRDYNWMAQAVGQANWQWFWSEGQHEGFWATVRPREGEEHALVQLAIEHDVVLLTSRPRAARKATIEWAASLHAPLMGVFLVEEASDKVGAAVGMRLEAIVDDKPSVLADAAVHNRLAWEPLLPIVYDQPWNQDIPRIGKGEAARVRNLTELRERLVERRRRLR